MSVSPPTAPTTDERADERGTPPLAGGAARAAGLLVGVGLLALATLLSLAVGALPVSLPQVIGAFTDFAGTDAHVAVRELRLPRTLVGIAVGAALGVAGTVIQGVTRNPLADPGILGIEAGAAFAVVTSIYVLGITSVSGYAWFALLGAAVAAVVVYTLGASGRAAASPVTLALAGAAVAALLTALTSAMALLDSGTLDAFRFWVVGSLAGRDLEMLAGAAPFLVVGVVLALLSGRALNALALGEDVARALGQRVALSRGLAAVGIVCCAGGAVSVAGPIGFVGLTVPHAARALVGPDYRWVLPYSMLMGPILLLVADVIGRVLVRPGELQVGIVMAAIGAPVFIALIRRGRLVQL
ncbi:FecCD family ABC transporter permease [Actinomycetospora callitridis]|uniref:FecCD family ABC transporter permease n=1 Tax=Actinomycetospora callitridis TaxID=913944 RepID=UPI0023650D92|nr:iron ABC transporter permease [Actinomycetospora callitridis]MDD7916650.1 iron ABC transporter permease [Actinomycetospora callitridis]